MNSRRILVLAAAAALACRCGEAPSVASSPVVAPPPRCLELETRMAECARAAAGVAELPPSVAGGVRDAAALDCRRLRAATGDHELPARIAEACAAADCAGWAGCVSAQAAAAGVDLAAPAATPTSDAPR